jgi:hypothetical protein
LIFARTLYIIRLHHNHRFLETAMRRRYLFVLPVMLGLAGFVRAPANDSTLTVELFCNNNGGGTFMCDAYVTGGTGLYTNYAWRVVEKYFSNTISDYRSNTSYHQIYGSCTVGNTVYATVTVTDSQGATGSGSGSIKCRWAAD